MTSPEQVARSEERLEKAYKSVRMAEVCAARVAQLANGQGSEKLAVERDRFQSLIERARRLWLGDLIDEAEREWQHFNAVADWVCGEPSGVPQLREAVDRFAAAIEGAAGERR